MVAAAEAAASPVPELPLLPPVLLLLLRPKSARDLDVPDEVDGRVFIRKTDIDGIGGIGGKVKILDIVRGREEFGVPGREKDAANIMVGCEEQHRHSRGAMVMQ